MQNALLVVQTVLAVILTGIIFLQSRGTGFARSSGGASSFTRRGLERVVFKLTFVTSAAFLLVSILSVSL